MSKWKQKRTSQKGQTVVEYLLLLALATITTYLLVSIPIAFGTQGILLTLKNALANVNQNADLYPGQLIQAGQSNHPSDPSRLKRLH